MMQSHLAESFPGLSHEAAVWYGALFILIVLGLIIYYLRKESRQDQEIRGRTEEMDATRRFNESLLRPATTPPRISPGPVRTAASTATPQPTNDDGDSGFATSMAIGMATDNALLATVVGGSVTGALVGVALDDAMSSQDACADPTTSPEDNCQDERQDMPNDEPEPDCRDDDTSGGDDSSGGSSDDW